MTFSIKHLFHINAPREKVYEAISTIEGISNWWSTNTSGDPELGGTIQFRFGEHGGLQMKVTKLIPNENVTWECVPSSNGWDNHIFTFALDENEGKTRVRFSQSGWTEQDDFYASCCFSWARYMESLRQLCQTGRGEAYGSESYRK